MKDDQFMISGIREERFKEMISGLKLSFDEQESLSGSCISLVNVIPSDKFVEIFLQTQNNVSKILLYKLAVYLKNKYNPNGEIKVSPRPKNDQGSLFEDEEERQRRYSGISSNDPPPTARRKIINKNTSKVVGKIDQSTNNFVDQSKKISTVDENKNQSTVEEKIISKSEEIAKPQIQSQIQSQSQSQIQPTKPIKGSITAINQLTDDKS